MKAIIVVRSNTDWGSMTMEKFAQQTFHVAKKNKNLVPFIQAWDQKFKMPYFAFRHHLQILAATSWAHMESVGAVIKGQENAVPLIDNFIGDFVVLPTDDDDWYHPQLVSRLASYSNDYEQAKWSMCLYSANKRIIKLHKPCYQTNTYGIFRKGWERLSPERKKNCIDWHLLASPALRDLHLIAIDEYLSTWNQTFASASLSRTLTRALDKMEQRALAGCHSKKIPEAAHWIIPYAKSLELLHQELF